MSHKYKVKDNDKPYFVTFATVYWLDVFTRNAYREASWTACGSASSTKGWKCTPGA